MAPSTRFQRTQPSACSRRGSVTNFATADTAMNTPGGTFDTTDQAKADFYHDKGPKTIGKKAYAHLIEAP